MADRLRAMRLRETFVVKDATLSSVRSTLTRIKKESGQTYTSRPDPDGVRVWRLS